MGVVIWLLQDKYILYVATNLCTKYMFHQVWYRGIVRATVSGVLEDLTFYISEGSDQNWLSQFSYIKSEWKRKFLFAFHDITAL